MKLARTPDLVPWYTIAEFAEGLGWTEANVIAAASAGHFPLVERTPIPGGAVLLTISAEHRAAFEAKHSAAAQPQEHPGKVKTAMWWTGAMVRLWVGNRPEDVAMLDEPYKLRTFLAGDFETQGVRMLRTDETDAEFLKEALRVFDASGCRNIARSIPRPAKCDLRVTAVGLLKANQAQEQRSK